MDQALKYVKIYFLVRFDNVIEIIIKTKPRTHAFGIYIELLTCKTKKTYLEYVGKYFKQEKQNQTNKNKSGGT